VPLPRAQICVVPATPRATVQIAGLYAITPQETDTNRLMRRVGRVLDGGCRLVQYRCKDASAEHRASQAAALSKLCESAGAALIVNDDAWLAAQVGAAGVHLGREDNGVAEARAMLPHGVVGVSCYDSLERALRLRAEGADYVAFGSFFPSAVKPGAVRPPLGLLGEARASLDCAVVAIGGVTRARAPQLLAAGAHALAVITDLFEAEDPAARAAEYVEFFQAA
jgi:thiamine-phosphate pyrophosphorylase